MKTLDPLGLIRLNDLELFSDVVQAKSISAAASLHGITPSAVSQRLSGLEKKLAVKLFAGNQRRPEQLSALGAVVWSQYQRMLADIHALRDPAKRRRVRFSMPQSLAFGWFAPKMRQFAEVLPDISIEVVTRSPSLTPLAMRIANVDIAISRVQVHCPRADSLRSYPELSGPVAQPQRAAEFARMLEAGAEQALCLLHDVDAFGWSPHANQKEWQAWFAAAGTMQPPRDCSHRYFNMSYLACGAAQLGRGVAIGRGREVAQALRKGLLVRLPGFQPQQIMCYEISAPNAATDSAVMRVFDLLDSWFQADAP